MWKDHKIQLAIAGFLLFFAVATVIAWKVPEMRAQFYSFVFMGLGAMYTSIALFVKPDGQPTTETPDAPASDAGSLPKPNKEN